MTKSIFSFAARHAFVIPLFTLGVLGTIACAPLAEAAPKVEYKISKPHALVVFWQALMEEPHYPANLRTALTSSPAYDDAAKTLIEELKESQKLLSQASWEYKGLGRERGSKLLELVSIQSAHADTLAELSSRIQGYLPGSKHRALMDQLKRLEAIYDPLIWKSTYPKLKEWKSELESLGSKAKLDEMFKLAQTFYGAEWPVEQNFLIALWPIPGLGGSNARSMGPLESVGILVETKDYAGVFAVTFHEICHSLYDAQPLALQKKLTDLWETSPSAYANLAHRYFNEGMATALGNGWAFERATGKLDESTWYNEPTIDGYGQALLPIARPYLAESKTIDHRFIDQAIEAFGKKFENAIYDYALLFNELILLSDGEIASREDIKKSLRSRFRVQSLSASSPIGKSESREDIKEQPKTTVLIVVAHSQIHQLLPLTQALPQLRPHLKEFERNNRGLVLTTVEKGRPLVVIQYRKLEEIEAAFELLKEQKRLDPKKTFQFVTVKPKQEPQEEPKTEPEKQ